MTITYDSITVGFLLSVPVTVALYHIVAITVAYAINDILADYREPVTFSRPQKYTMLVEMKQSYKSYTCTPLPERKMVYKSYSVKALV